MLELGQRRLPRWCWFSKTCHQPASAERTSDQILKPYQGWGTGNGRNQVCGFHINLEKDHKSAPAPPYAHTPICACKLLIKPTLLSFLFCYFIDYFVVKGRNPIVEIAEGSNMGAPSDSQCRRCPNTASSRALKCDLKRVEDNVKRISVQHNVKFPVHWHGVCAV